MNIYMDLTNRFNTGRTRTILAGGQAAVLHRLAMMSKDGDWILREESEAVDHVLTVLAGYRARYRFGAPLDVRWLSGGWSSHLEFQWQELRIRTDFVTRPPRLDREAIDRLWREGEDAEVPFADARDLAEMKKTNREKDYVVIGELARRMSGVDDRILYSRSARDLTQLAQEHPDRVQALIPRRPVLEKLAQGQVAMEAALDAERRRLMRANEERLARYMEAAQGWAAIWAEVSRQMQELGLPEAHELMVRRAESILPFSVPGGWP